MPMKSNNMSVFFFLALNFNFSSPELPGHLKERETGLDKCKHLSGSGDGEDDDGRGSSSRAIIKWN